MILFLTVVKNVQFVPKLPFLPCSPMLLSNRKNVKLLTFWQERSVHSKDGYYGNSLLYKVKSISILMTKYPINFLEGLKIYNRFHTISVILAGNHGICCHGNQKIYYQIWRVFTYLSFGTKHLYIMVHTKDLWPSDSVRFFFIKMFTNLHERERVKIILRWKYCSEI